MLLAHECKTHSTSHFGYSQESLMQVTPAGFAQMTHMLSGLSHGKLLVILEGGLVVYP